MRQINFFIKEFLKVFIVSFFIIAIFITYLVFIGIPKTQARNTYLQAEFELEKGNTEIGIALLEESLRLFPENYARDKLQILNK